MYTPFLLACGIAVAPVRHSSFHSTRFLKKGCLSLFHQGGCGELFEAGAKLCEAFANRYPEWSATASRHTRRDDAALRRPSDQCRSPSIRYQTETLQLDKTTTSMTYIYTVQRLEAKLTELFDWELSRSLSLRLCLLGSSLPKFPLAFVPPDDFAARVTRRKPEVQSVKRDLAFLLS